MEFFQTSQQLEDLANLEKYTKTASSSVAHITGSSLLYERVAEHAKNKKSLQVKKKALLKQLQEKENVTEKEVYQRGKREAADMKRAALQQDIEIVCCSIETRRVAIGKEAGKSYLHIINKKIR